MLSLRDISDSLGRDVTCTRKRGLSMSVMCDRSNRELVRQTDSYFYNFRMVGAAGLLRDTVSGGRTVVRDWLSEREEACENGN